VATITINTAAEIEFKELLPGVPVTDLPFLIAQSGNWEFDGKSATGVIIDGSRLDEPPTVLTSDNARKLAKWLIKAADTLDTAESRGVKKKRTYYEQDDEEYGYKT
jgi:hypothetical protein